MANRSNPSFLLTVLFIGLVNAAVFGWGFWLMAKTVERQRFGSTSASTSNFPQQEVVPLSNDRFAVVDGNATISVYKVDLQGNVTRVSDVATSYAELLPNERPVLPRPTVQVVRPTDQPPVPSPINQAATPTGQLPTARPTPTNFQ